MKYTGNAGFSHHQADKIGVLITNLGTPQAPTKGALAGRDRRRARAAYPASARLTPKRVAYTPGF